MGKKVNVVIPLAGLGSRFSEARYRNLKPFIHVCDDTMIRQVLKNLNHSTFRFLLIINTEQISEEEFSNHIKDLNVDYRILTTDKKTEGPACTALLAKTEINNDEPLIIVNCDQIIKDFNPEIFCHFATVTQADGILGCFVSSSKKNSYVKLDANGEVTEVKEKIVISNIATNGLHFWKKGSYFIDSAEEMITKNDRHSGEFYIAPTYNYLLNAGKKIIPYFFNLHFPIGTPEDLQTYLTIYDNKEIL